MTEAKRKSIVEMLKNGVTEVDFTKVDGTNRKMKCTLNFDLIPNEWHPQDLLAETPQDSPTIKCFDLEKNGWRSFRVDSVNDVRSSS
jgi:hypothetical protein